MKAVILAAGRGTRIERAIHGVPKCLIEFSRRTILDYQIAGLWTAGVSDIAIVTGHKSRYIVDHVARTFPDQFDSFTFIDNPSFAKTNNIYSLWMAREWVKSSDFVCLNADVLCHPRIIARAANPGDVSMMVDPEWRDETMKVIVRDGSVLRMSKGISRSEYSGTYIGITAFSRQVTPMLFKEIAKMLSEGRVNEFFNAAVQQLVDRGLRVGVKSTRGLPWAEIDDEADLAFARATVYPRLPRLSAAYGPGEPVAAVA